MTVAAREPRAGAGTETRHSRFTKTMNQETQDETRSYEFKAEVKQLLDILIHSVYTAKDIFIRELLSNAADALEKVRFRQVREEELADPDAPLEVTISIGGEGERKTLVIADRGIGMSEDEIRTNLGTIAHSGATAFLDELKGETKKDLSLIGRFGVGFYSVFMVADEVVVTSRSANPAAAPVRWSSDGLGSYAVSDAPTDTPRGTRIEIRLKKDEERFAEKSTIEQAIRKYSNFIPFAIRLEDEQVNQTSALWREPPHQVKAEQYTEFHKFANHAYEDPLLHLHLSVDAPLQFSALLFVPKTNTEVLGFGERKVSLQLYVKRVLIDGENENLLPSYLRFVQGVVECEDLPLNVSRETLQENPLVAKIRDTLTKKLLKQFADLAANDREKYGEFWQTFGRFIKEGHSDFAHRESIVALLRFDSSHSEKGDDLYSLADYVGRMPEGQKAIYYLSGPSRDALVRDPRLEIFRKRGVEVLYLSDLADEFVLGNLGRFEEKELVSADQVKPEDLKELGGDGESPSTDEGDDTSVSADSPDVTKLIDRFKSILGERVEDIRTSERLVDSPACLVGDQVSGHMDKMLRLMNKDVTLPKKTLELNPKHALIRSLERLVERDEEPQFVERVCEQIFEGAMLADGYLTDPHELVRRMHTLMEDAATQKAGPGED